MGNINFEKEEERRKIVKQIKKQNNYPK